MRDHAVVLPGGELGELRVAGVVAAHLDVPPGRDLQVHRAALVLPRHRQVLVPLAAAVVEHGLCAGLVDQAFDVPRLGRQALPGEGLVGRESPGAPRPRGASRGRAQAAADSAGSGWRGCRSSCANYRRAAISSRLRDLLREPRELVELRPRRAALDRLRTPPRCRPRGSARGRRRRWPAPAFSATMSRGSARLVVHRAEHHRPRFLDVGHLQRRAGRHRQPEVLRVDRRTR